MARPRRFPWSRGPVDDRTTVVRPPATAVRTEEYVDEPPPPPPPGPPPREWWPWLLALALLVVGAILGYFLFRGSDGDKGKTTTVVTQSGVAVPGVVGLTQEKATAQLASAGLQPDVKRQTSEKAKDTVVSQAPAAGAHVDPGSDVKLIVSAGRSGVEVPDVVGLKAPAAVTKLKSAKLGAKVVSVFSDKPKGTVVRQTPAGGDRVQDGSEVRLDVSKGDKRVAVPDLVGRPSAEAQASLKQLGFTYTIIVVPSDEPRGTVVSQDPQGGETASQGSNVRLNVARGGGGGGAATTTTATTTQTSTGATPARVSVPNVVNTNQTTAQRRLQAAGLTSGVRYVASTQPAGRVVAQSPAPGTSVRRGSRVQLSVSTGPNPQASRPVPDVVGQDEQTATTTLQQAGFTVLPFDEPTTDQSEDGIVLDEQPAGGTRAPRGSTITIYVGRLSSG
jgi:serine/threonine-protein kinase